MVNSPRSRSIMFQTWYQNTRSWTAASAPRVSVWRGSSDPIVRRNLKNENINTEPFGEYIQYCANQLGQGDLFNGNWVNCNPGFCRRVLALCNTSEKLNIFLTTWYKCTTLSRKPAWNHCHRKSVSFFSRFDVELSPIHVEIPIKNRRPTEVGSSK